MTIVAVAVVLMTQLRMALWVVVGAQAGQTSMKKPAVTAVN
jgi:hypothetical protein